MNTLIGPLRHLATFQTGFSYFSLKAFGKADYKSQQGTQSHFSHVLPLSVPENLITTEFIKSSQVELIYIVLYTMQTVSKQLHSNKEENNSINVAITSHLITTMTHIQW